MSSDYLLYSWLWWPCADEGQGTRAGPTATGTPSIDSSNCHPEFNAHEKTAVANLEQALLNFDILDSSNARCLATGYVDTLGIEWLQEHGMLERNLSSKQTYFEGAVSKQDANGYYDVYFSCVDYRALVAVMVADPPDMKDPYVIRCMNAVSEAETHDAFVAGASDQDFHATLFARSSNRQAVATRATNPHTCRPKGNTAAQRTRGKLPAVRWPGSAKGGAQTRHRSPTWPPGRS
jgi:hypothetical protein